MAAVTIECLIESGLSTDTVLVEIMNYFSRALMGRYPLLPRDGNLTKDQCRTVFQLRQNRKRDEQQNPKIKTSIFWMYGCVVGRGASCFPQILEAADSQEVWQDGAPRGLHGWVEQKQPLERRFVSSAKVTPSGPQWEVSRVGRVGEPHPHQERGGGLW